MQTKTMQYYKQGYPYDITSEGNPQNNKLKYQSGAHTCMQRVPTTVAQFDTCMSGHCIYYTFKPEIKHILGNTSIGWTRRVSSPKGWTKLPPG